MTDNAFVIVQYYDALGGIRTLGSYPQEIRIRLAEVQPKDLLGPSAADGPTFTDGDVKVGGTVDRDGERADEHYIDASNSAPEAMSRNSGEEAARASRSTFDRASVVVTAILQISGTVQRRGLRRALVAYIRDELADVQRQAIADREPFDE